MANCFYNTGIDEAAHIEKTFYWPWITWKNWKSRNELLFSNIHLDPRQLVASALEEASEWKDNQPDKVVMPPANALKSNRWIPPPMGILKCNVDATWSKSSLNCGVSWIVRDNAGEVRWIGAKCYPHLSSPMEAEAATFSWAAMCLRNMGYKDIQIESDCQSLIIAANNPSERPALAAYTAEISDYKQSNNFSLHFSNGLGNMCADKMAETICLCLVYFAILDQTCPLWLFPLLETDKPYMAQL